MAKHYEDPIVKCPFYSWEDGLKLCCEGMNNDCTVQVTFTNKQTRREYERNFCKKGWKACPLAQALEKKWDLETKN